MLKYFPSQLEHNTPAGLLRASEWGNICGSGRVRRVPRRHVSEQITSHTSASFTDEVAADLNGIVHRKLNPSRRVITHKLTPDLPPVPVTGHAMGVALARAYAVSCIVVVVRFFHR